MRYSDLLENYFLDKLSNLKQVFSKVTIILHGSRVIGNYYPASDLDVLILTEKCLGRKGIDIAYEILGEEVNGIKLDIQVICYNDKNTFFVRNVLAKEHTVIIDELLVA